MKSSEVSTKRVRSDARAARFSVEMDYAREVAAYRSSGRLMPLLLLGDAQAALDKPPASSIDFAMRFPTVVGEARVRRRRHRPARAR